MQGQWVVLAAATWAFPCSTLAAKLNADTILLSLWPWVAVAWMQAHVLRARWSWAVALGVLSALAMLAKYYSGVLLLGFFLSSLCTTRSRSWYSTATPWIAMALFLVCLLPHVQWEMQHDFITLRYVERHGVAHVVWGDFWKFMFSPVLYWPFAWIGVALLISPVDQRWRGLGRRMLACWRPPSWSDPLLWMVLMPWLITLLFGLSAFVKLTIHWAIPIAFAYPVFWVRNLSQACSDSGSVPDKNAQRAYTVGLVVVVMVGLLAGWSQARSDQPNNYYLPRSEAANEMLSIWKQRYPNVPLRWIGGQWQENGMMAFYADRGLYTLPQTPDGVAAQTMPYNDWASSGGGLLCPVGWVVTETMDTQQLNALAQNLDTECARESKQWMTRTGQNQAPIVVASRRSGWGFPRSYTYAYVLFVYLPH
jgi:4-amino-4-deoxy-L-arabinose transferase-like glycosyltransferase